MSANVSLEPVVAESSCIPLDGCCVGSPGQPAGFHTLRQELIALYGSFGLDLIELRAQVLVGKLQPHDLAVHVMQLLALPLNLPNGGTRSRLQS